MDKTELGRRIYAASHLTGLFTLRSGQTSSEYFDKYKFESNPLLITEVARHLSQLVPDGTEVLAGLELGGIPLATALSMETGIPTAFVRKKAKDYGTKNLVEGEDVSDRTVCVVEDVTTTGGQIIESSLSLREMGAKVEHALCVVIRDDIAIERLKAVGIEIRYLFHMDDLK